MTRGELITNHGSPANAIFDADGLTRLIASLGANESYLIDIGLFRVFVPEI